jgi:hypothetical protein
MARLLSLGAWKLAGLIQQGINFPLQLFHGSEFIGKALSREQKLLVAVGPNLLQQAFELLKQGLAQLFQFGESLAGDLSGVVVQDATSH